MLQKYNSMKIKKTIVLTDNKIGSNSQAIALAEALGAEFEIIPLEYNLLARLPNFLLPFGFKQVKKPNLNEILRNIEPEYIISASRKSGFVSASIKKIKKNAKNIHILNPGINFSNFDLVVLPNHDIVRAVPSNVFRISGALNNISQNIISELENFKNIYPELAKRDSNKKIITVLVGGNTKKFKYDQTSATKFTETLAKISQNMQAKFMITLSRRTNGILKELLLEFAKNHNHFIYDPEKPGYNPYPAMLDNSEFVISTIDSISMCSEVASLGKPLYLYKPENFNSAKHFEFSKELERIGAAKFITPDVNNLQEYNYEPLSETKKLVDYINSSNLSVK